MLDTCALIWIAEGEAVSSEALELLDEANNADVIVYMSPISAWEIGLLASRAQLKLLITPQRWFHRLFEFVNVELRLRGEVVAMPEF